MSNLEQIRDTVRDEHCPMCGTQRCDGSDEMMEGCGHYAHLQGKETEHEKLMKIMKEELQKEKGSDLEQKVREVLGLCAYTAPRNREIIDQSVTAIMEEVGKEGCDCNNCMSECKEIVGLRAEIVRLRGCVPDERDNSDRLKMSDYFKLSTGIAYNNGYNSAVAEMNSNINAKEKA